jgi:hypothetical protein
MGGIVSMVERRGPNIGVDPNSGLGERRREEGGKRRNLLFGLLFENYYSVMRRIFHETEVGLSARSESSSSRPEVLPC